MHKHHRRIVRSHNKIEDRRNGH